MTFVLEADDANDLYKRVMRHFTVPHTTDVAVSSVRHVSPRGLGVRETLSAMLTLRDVSKNLVTLPERRLNFTFAVAEWLWMLHGSNEAKLIMGYNKNLGFSLDDGAERFSGAYGPKIVEQLDYVRQVLAADPDSRQAVISIWRERPRLTKDVPCTLSMQFFIRDNALHMMTTMRSNDVWLGLPYDLFSFTQIQRSLARDLGIDTGEYYHHVGSFHLYDRDFDGAHAVAHSMETMALVTPIVPEKNERGKLFTLMRVFEAEPERALQISNDWLKRGVLHESAAPYARTLVTRWNPNATRNVWPWVSAS